MNFILWLVIIIVIYILYNTINKKEHYIVFGRHKRYPPPDYRRYGYYTRWFDRPWTWWLKNIYNPISYNKYLDGKVPYNLIYYKHPLYSTEEKLNM